MGFRDRRTRKRKKPTTCGHSRLLVEGWKVALKGFRFRPLRICIKFEFQEFRVLGCFGLRALGIRLYTRFMARRLWV